MKRIRLAARLFIFGCLVVAYLGVSFFDRWRSDNIVERRKRAVKVVSLFCRWSLRILNFKVHLRGAVDRQTPQFLIGNHLGILDIFVTSSQIPSLFITSTDMRGTPGLGLLTEMGGCLFVDRRSRSRIQADIQQIREALQQGFNIVLYPEGTSGNGERLLPFKKSLLTAAAGTGTPLVPLVINYQCVNSEKMSAKWRDHVFWYGDQKFFPALLRILSLDSAEAELDFGPAVRVHSEEDRRQAAEAIYSYILEKFTPIR